METRLLEPTEVLQQWEDIRPLIHRVNEKSYGLYTTEDILYELLEANFQLWTITKGAKLRAVFITVVTDYPQKRVCDVMWLAGEGIHEWLNEALAALESWARTLGCDLLRPTGRKAWGRLGGFKKEEEVFLKEPIDRDWETT